MLKNNVLRNEKDFNRIYNRGKKGYGKYIVIFCLKNGMKFNRISYIASKKVGNSVHRNRARRLMRESIRLIPIEKQGYDMILIAKNSINDEKCADVKKSIESALRKLEIIGNGAKK